MGPRHQNMVPRKWAPRFRPEKWNKVFTREMEPHADLHRGPPGAWNTGCRPELQCRRAPRGAEGGAVTTLVSGPWALPRSLQSRPVRALLLELGQVASPLQALLPYLVGL